jgi:hypothetical protein
MSDDLNVQYFNDPVATSVVGPPAYEPNVIMTLIPTDPKILPVVGQIAVV